MKLRLPAAGNTANRSTRSNPGGSVPATAHLTTGVPENKRSNSQAELKPDRADRAACTLPSLRRRPARSRRISLVGDANVNPEVYRDEPKKSCVHSLIDAFGGKWTSVVRPGDLGCAPARRPLARSQDTERCGPGNGWISTNWAPTRRTSGRLPGPAALRRRKERTWCSRELAISRRPTFRTLRKSSST